MRTGLTKQEKTTDIWFDEKIRQSVVRPDNPAVRGQVHKVRHLVSVEEVD